MGRFGSSVDNFSPPSCEMLYFQLKNQYQSRIGQNCYDQIDNSVIEQVYNQLKDHIRGQTKWRISNHILDCLESY